MSRRRLVLAGVGAVALLLVFAFAIRNTGAPPSPLSVTFVGWTNNPARTPPPARLEVCRGVTGQCALFWVTNNSSADRLWFQTFQLELKVDGQWQLFFPPNPKWRPSFYANPKWGGVEGSMWTPQYACLYAVGLPAGLPSNAVWRLQVACGRELSPWRSMINQKLGRTIFRRRAEYVAVASSEVNP